MQSQCASHELAQLIRALIIAELHVYSRVPDISRDPFPLPIASSSYMYPHPAAPWSTSCMYTSRYDLAYFDYSPYPYTLSTNWS